MPQKQKISVQTLPEIPSDWFNQLSSQIKTEHDLSSFMAQFMKQLVERQLAGRNAQKPLIVALLFCQFINAQTLAPPFQVTPAILNQVAGIAHVLGS